jgi:hypothetical protein
LKSNRVPAPLKSTFCTKVRSQIKQTIIILLETNTKQDATEYMDKIGFKLNKIESFMENEAIGEENLVFDNTI